MGDPLIAFAARHVETFNASVRTGDFTPLVQLFADDASLEFVGVPAGPFEGRAAIDAAYRAQPPTDTLTVLSIHVEDDGTVVEPFSWSTDAGAYSGEMRLVVAGDRIRRLVISF